MFLRDKVVLVVDDWEVDRIRIVERLRSELGAQFIVAPDGIAALEAIERHKPDIVVTDLMMPRMDGLRLVECIRKRYTFLPAVLVTSSGSEDIAVKALTAGAVNYVSKQELERLTETVIGVLEMSIGYRQQETLRSCWANTQSEFTIGNDEAMVSILVSHLQQQAASMRGLDETETFRLGVALHEALRNAIEHGNLEANSSLRQVVPTWAGGTSPEYYELIEERKFCEPYCRRRVSILVRETPQEARYTIRDEGPGFDIASLSLDPQLPENLTKPSGRGLFLIRTFMDEVIFNEQGNEITMVHRYSPLEDDEELMEEGDLAGCVTASAGCGW